MKTLTLTETGVEEEEDSVIRTVVLPDSSDTGQKSTDLYVLLYINLKETIMSSTLYPLKKAVFPPLIINLKIKIKVFQFQGSGS